MKWLDREKCTAYNKRFGVMRGVCSQKVLQEFESFVPVRAFAFPRPNAKPPTVKLSKNLFILLEI